MASSTSGATLWEPAAAIAKSPGSALINMNAMNDTPSRITKVQANRVRITRLIRKAAFAMRAKPSATSSPRSCARTSGY